MERGSYMLIEPGFAVHGTDGALGTVIEVVADAGVDVFRGIVISHGLIMPKHSFIHPDFIISVDDRNVQVNLSKQQIDQLPTGAEVATAEKGH